MTTFLPMVPRWSRLALAALLACGVFGAQPGQAQATATGADRGAAEPALAHGPPMTVVAAAAEAAGDATPDRATTPIHALIGNAVASAPACGPVVRVGWAVLTSRVLPEPAWRLAPKTSPPRR